MKFLEKLFSFIYGVQIALSPILIGVICGVIIWTQKKDDLGLALGISCFVAGIIIGVVWAIRIAKKHGTVEFMSRIHATPELDKKEDEKIKK